MYLSILLSTVNLVKQKIFERWRWRRYFGTYRAKKRFIQRRYKRFNDEITKKISQSKFLILGAAGSIGQAVTTEIFKEILRCCMLLI